MTRKRIENAWDRIAKCGTVATDVELLLLAAIVDEIAAMESQPLALPPVSAKARRRSVGKKRRCAT